MPTTPPKEFWDRMYKEVKQGNPEYSDEQVRKTVGDIWYHKMSPSKKQTETKKSEGSLKKHANKFSVAEGFADALFKSSWADFQEEQGESFAGIEILDVAPATPQEVKSFADRKVSEIEAANGISFDSFVPPGEQEGSFDPWELGWYLGMQYLGHGVSWSDDHEDHGLQIPYGEFAIMEHDPENDRYEFYMEGSKKKAQEKQYRAVITLQPSGDVVYGEWDAVPDTAQVIGEERAKDIVNTGIAMGYTIALETASGMPSAGQPVMPNIDESDWASALEKLEGSKKAAAKIRKIADRFSSSDPEQLERYLAGVVTLDGEGSITVHPDKDPPVNIAIVHDSSGFNPGAAIYVSDWEGPDTTLQNAFEILENKVMEDQDHVKEIMEEWGDDWNEILTEAFDGMVFTVPASVAAKIISSDRFAKEYIAVDHVVPENWDKENQPEELAKKEFMASQKKRAGGVPLLSKDAVEYIRLLVLDKAAELHPQPFQNANEAHASIDSAIPEVIKKLSEDLPPEVKRVVDAERANIFNDLTRGLLKEDDAARPSVPPAPQAAPMQPGAVPFSTPTTPEEALPAAAASSKLRNIFDNSYAYDAIATLLADDLGEEFPKKYRADELIDEEEFILDVAQQAFPDISRSNLTEAFGDVLTDSYQPPKS